MIVYIFKDDKYYFEIIHNFRELTKYYKLYYRYIFITYNKINNNIIDYIWKQLDNIDYYYININKEIKYFSDLPTNHIIFSKYVLDNYNDLIYDDNLTKQYLGRIIELYEEVYYYDILIYSDIDNKYINKIENIGLCESNNIKSYDDLCYYIEHDYIIFSKQQNKKKVEYIESLYLNLNTNISYNITKYTNITKLKRINTGYNLSINNNIYYYNNKWSNNLEHIIFKEIYNTDITYLAFPWTTLINEINEYGTSDLLFILDNKINKIGLITICDHSNFKDILYVFKIIGISILFTPYINYPIYNEQNNIYIYPTINNNIIINQLNQNNKIKRFSWSSRNNNYLIISDKYLLIRSRYDILFDFITYYVELDRDILMILDINTNEWLIKINYIIHNNYFKKDLIMISYIDIDNDKIKLINNLNIKYIKCNDENDVINIFK